MSVSALPSFRVHWKLNAAFARPSSSAMPGVLAVSVWPTWAVPLMVGAPVAGLFPTGVNAVGRISTGSDALLSAYPNNW